MIYDILLNLSIPGGFMMLVGGSFVAVILSFTPWNQVIPRKLNRLSGVNVVPANLYYYAIGITLGIMAKENRGDNWAGNTAIYFSPLMLFLH